MAWNVHGLKTKVNNSELLDTLNGNSIICLSEVWSQDENEFCNLLTDYTCFRLVHKRVSTFGRNIGGICVYVHDSIVKYLYRICVQATDCVVLYSDKESGLFEDNTVLIFTYIFPEGASSYRKREEKNGIVSLENEILNVLDQFGEDVKLIIAGDFNARTGNECDYIECDD